MWETCDSRRAAEQKFSGGQPCERCSKFKEDCKYLEPEIHEMKKEVKMETKKPAAA